jgi:hypothetical protein
MIQNHKVLNLEYGTLLMAQKEHGPMKNQQEVYGQAKIRTNLELGNSILILFSLEPGWMTLATSMGLGLLMTVKSQSNTQPVKLLVYGTLPMSPLDSGTQTQKALVDTGRKMMGLTQVPGSIWKTIIRLLEDGSMTMALPKELGCQMRTSPWLD